MSTTYTITEKTGYTRARTSSSFKETRTFQDNHFRLDKVAVVAEANSIFRDAHMRYFHGIGMPEIDNDYSDEEELEWNAFFARPDVQAELERLAEEAERQFAAGETEEGGFAIE